MPNLRERKSVVDRLVLKCYKRVAQWFINFFATIIMKKSKRLGLVLAPMEKKAVAILARSRGGLSQSALIRCLIYEAAQASGLMLN